MGYIFHFAGDKKQKVNKYVNFVIVTMVMKRITWKGVL